MGNKRNDTSREGHEMFKTNDNDTLKQDKSVNHAGTSFCQPCLEVQQLTKQI